MSDFSQNLVRFRRQNHLTQDALAQRLNLTFQAVSKWETGQSMPDLDQLRRLADIFLVSTDALLGHTPAAKSENPYVHRYNQDEYYWGLAPSSMCYEVMRLLPPVRPLRVLDVGCGEGKDAVFFARNGYIVSAFDLAETGLDKGRRLAERCGADVHFFRADVNDYRPDTEYDIIFSSGVLHYIPEALRDDVFASYQSHTAPGGIHAMNVFVRKSFIPDPPDETAPAYPWRSGELAMRYGDWKMHSYYETIFDCESAGVPHQHCMNVMIAERIL